MAAGKRFAVGDRVKDLGGREHVVTRISLGGCGQTVWVRSAGPGSREHPCHRDALSLAGRAKPAT
jgi:hypothetical protein